MFYFLNWNILDYFWVCFFICTLHFFFAYLAFFSRPGPVDCCDYLGDQIFVTVIIIWVLYFFWNILKGRIMLVCAIWAWIWVTSHIFI